MPPRVEYHTKNAESIVMLEPFQLTEYKFHPKQFGRDCPEQ
jgi:hypothetical protein